MAQVCVLSTGGTISMRDGQEGLSLDHGYLTGQLAAFRSNSPGSLPQFDLLELDPLHDSANMSPADWVKIAGAILDCRSAYQGFVVVHGTDTMAYTASALAFLLRGMNKPIILTGAQIPLFMAGSDGYANLSHALAFAGMADLYEVCIYFGGKLLRGCRAIKADAERPQAFDSPNYPLLGEGGHEPQVNWDHVLPAYPTPPTPLPDPHHLPQVGLLKLFPGLTRQMAAGFFQPSLRGLVLETYGRGSGLQNNPDLLEQVSSAVRDGLVVVNCTQCTHGSTGEAGYPSGSLLVEAGVIYGRDMTVPAALSKLFTLLAQGRPSTQVRSLMQQSLCGEIT
jgi:L-asparaginase